MQTNICVLNAKLKAKIAYLTATSLKVLKLIAVLQPHEFFHAPQPVKYPPYSFNISIAMLTVNTVEIGL